jgi:DNA-directed RNA polymerase specialized sigma24 family protein
MKITDDQFKEIMDLFDAGDHESRKQAISMLYLGFRDHYLIVIKRDFMHNKYDDAMAEEVLQDVFLSLLSKLTKPSSQYAISAWLKSYVFNVTRDRMKKSGFEVLPYDPDNGRGEIPSNPRDSIMIEKCVEEIIKNCNKDNPEGMELFSKVKVEGFAYSELTNIYGKTVSNLKKIVSEVNTILKDLTQPCYERSK